MLRGGFTISKSYQFLSPEGMSEDEDERYEISFLAFRGVFSCVFERHFSVIHKGQDTPILFACTFATSDASEAAALHFFDVDRIVGESVDSSSADMIELIKSGAMSLHNRQTGRVLLPLLALEDGISIGSMATMIEDTNTTSDNLMMFEWARLCVHEICHSVGLGHFGDGEAAIESINPLHRSAAPSTDEIQRIVDAILGDAPNEST